MNKLWITALALFAINANALELEGVFKQGGLIAVKDVNKYSSITINGTKIDTTEQGDVYYPVGRKAEKLEVKYAPKGVANSLTKYYELEKQEYKVQHIKGIKKKHVTPDPEHLKRIGKESKEIKASRVGNSAKYFNTALPEFILPTTGVETGVYGSSRTYNGEERNWHKGLDIANKEGTMVFAPLKGKVVLAMKDSFFNGNLVIIDHGKKIYSIYAHLYDIIANKGDIVEVGDPIGLMGTTGRSTGSHLHWGVYVGHQAVDPKFLLKD
tara:strand:- start:8479 stop:9282 length:804 start_codon:yes stop_codon:yes gene_type:complete